MLTKLLLPESYLICIEKKVTTLGSWDINFIAKKSFPCSLGHDSDEVVDVCGCFVGR